MTASVDDERPNVASDELTNADRFLDAFNGIEDELARLAKADRYTPFAQLVRQSRDLTPMQREMLLKWAELRNVIVHTPRRGNPSPIADPRIDVVASIETQLDLLVRPPRVLDILRPKPPRTLSSEQSVREFIKEVALPNDFSQSPVRMPNGSLSLITTNAFTRWIASGYDDAGAIIEDAPIADVLDYREPGDAVKLAPRTLTAVQAWSMFSGEHGVAPTAIALSHSGKESESLLALVVKSDVPALLRALGV
ncbi:hypothetical protein [Microbacterium sp. NPDC056569]|uniref:hypothetical protein n=1 Tax=Microbacterium sp. NPDC056569 TaxID=3345867 RepID=UPI00366CF65D